jgi:hypothetical protein
MTAEEVARALKINLQHSVAVAKVRLHHHIHHIEHTCHIGYFTGVVFHIDAIYIYGAAALIICTIFALVSGE